MPPSCSPAWPQYAATILQEQRHVTLLPGRGDAGKSSYCRFLAAELLGAGHQVAVVDATWARKTSGRPPQLRSAMPRPAATYGRRRQKPCSGRDLAIGAAHVLATRAAATAPANVVRCAIETAVAFDTGCGGDAWVFELVAE